MKSIELLAPVGSFESLYAAINAGCNAVYLAGKNYGARSFAGNFSKEEIVETIKICHLYGVKVYITVNTLIYDVEVNQFMDYIDFLHLNNVDAVIMQDIGMIDLVRKTYPNLEIHASTQANIHNLEGAKLCEQLGIKRVVLARETPIELIKEIKENTNLEIEIFIHGALCMSYSGECLLSSLIGSRSGNRGTCAQPCRQLYSLSVNDNIVSSNKYLLSTKDLNTLDYLNQLIDIGIDSLKIEGRMKRSEYVYLVVNTYRLAIDNYLKYGKINITDKEIKELKKIFNREFTKGFIFHEDNDSFVNINRPNHLGIEIGKVIDCKKNYATIKLSDELSINDGIRIIDNCDIGFIVTKIFKDNKPVTKAFKNDIISIPVKTIISKNSIVNKTTDYNQLQEINKKIKTNKKIKITGKCIIKNNSKIEFSITDYVNSITVYSDYITEVSNNNPITEEIVKKQLSRIGNTIYEYELLDIKLDNNVFIPVSVLNELRVIAIEKLNNLRMYKTNYKKEKYSIDLSDYEQTQNKNILLNTYDEYLKNKNKYDIIIFDDYDSYKKANDNKSYYRLDRINEHLPNYNGNLLVNDLGSVYKYKNVDTDFSLNVFNSYSVAFLHSIGVNKITLSYELNYKQIKRLIDEYHNRYHKHPNLEVIISGYEEVMVCKYNMLKKYNTNKGYLIDRFNNKYSIIIKNNFMRIYNYKKRNLTENYFEIGINNIRVNR